MPEAIFVDGCHGNAEIHMHIKFVWFASFRIEEIVKCKSIPRQFFVDGCHGNYILFRLSIVN